MARLVVTGAGGTGRRLDGGEPEGLPAAPLPRPLGVQGGAGREVLGGPRDRAHPFRPRQGSQAARALSALGLAVLVWGLVVLDGWMVAAGLATQMTGKIWFLDRMVWLYEDMTRDLAP
jgi:hypothetical protein